MSDAFLTARWRHLAMLNWEIDPEFLRPRVPAGTELDSHGGRTFVSVVGFLFLDTKVLGVPIPLHRDFEELNLRYYVRREGEDGLRRGVVFVKEIVPKSAIAFVARTVYNENYEALPMRHDVAMPDDGAPGPGRAEYGWLREGRWNGIEAETSDPPYLPDESSEEAFITEHYWGYVSSRGGGTTEYRVEHPRWRVRKAEAKLDADVAANWGQEFVGTLAGPPVSAFVAEGSEVVVRKGSRLEPRPRISERRSAGELSE